MPFYINKLGEAISREQAMKKELFYVYIMTNKNNNVLYTGMNNDLKRRTYEHKMKLIEGFTKKYNCTKLVFYEIYRDSYQAIVREKQIKAGSRKKKIELIEKMNPTWRDLAEDFE